MVTTHKTDQSEDMRARVRGGNLTESFVAAVTAAIEQAAIDESVPVSLDLDSRGSATRISITVEKHGEPGIVKTRRY